MRLCSASHCSLISENSDTLVMGTNSSQSVDRVSIPRLFITSKPGLFTASNIADVLITVGSRKEFFFWLDIE